MEGTFHGSRFLRAAEITDWIDPMIDKDWPQVKARLEAWMPVNFDEK